MYLKFYMLVILKAGIFFFFAYEYIVPCKE